MKDIPSNLREIFQKWSGEPCQEIIPLPDSGSERKYWRLKGRSAKAIGVYHPVKEESRAFLAFTGHFLKKGQKVPQIYNTDLVRNIYLMQDLGDTTLFSLVNSRQETGLPVKLFSYYENALEELVKFQVLAGKDLDYTACFPRSSFDKQSVIWDLNYFKYNFLKLLTTFNEQKLEEDFQKFTEYLSLARADFFMYRDFQSRNIMIFDNSLYFIDYQGGRRGPLQYDPVSLLFQVRADIPFDDREKLLNHYLSCLQQTTKIDKGKFLEFYNGFILLRLLQVLGAYGFRGLIQKKSHFITSLPYAIKNIVWYLDNRLSPIQIPELYRCLAEISINADFPLPENITEQGLTVTVRSFAYKNGIPDDLTGNGGGFVFDCRALPNPGREETMRNYTGKDEVIRKFLNSHQEVLAFQENAFEIIDQSVNNYLERGFHILSVSFGCTGGQHRSVYFAERLSEHLRNKFPKLFVKLVHRELDPDHKSLKDG
jgi:aminoglycoside/choline kinase family phosphotransferase